MDDYDLPAGYAWEEEQSNNLSAPQSDFQTVEQEPLAPLENTVPPTIPNNTSNIIEQTNNPHNNDTSYGETLMPVYDEHSETANQWLSGDFLFANVGAPFLIGLAVGFFAKKILKLALFLAGAAIVLLFVSEYYGVTQVNDEGLKNVADSASQLTQQSGSFLMDRLSNITSKGLSATAGFLAGLKLG